MTRALPPPTLCAMPYCAYCGREISGLAAACPQCGHPNEARAPVATVTAKPQPRAVTGHVLAHWGKRALAAIIDSILIGIVTAVMRVLAGIQVHPFLFAHPDGSLTFDGSAFAHGFLLSIALGWAVSAAYRVPFEGSTGQTLGKMALRLRLVDRRTGGTIGYGRAFARLVVYDLLSVVVGIGTLFDLLWPLWDADRQTLHDKAVGSVVRDESTPPTQNTAPAR